jgi:hypothetical protein
MCVDIEARPHPCVVLLEYEGLHPPGWIRYIRTLMDQNRELLGRSEKWFCTEVCRDDVLWEEDDRRRDREASYAVERMFREDLIYERQLDPLDGYIEEEKFIVVTNRNGDVAHNCLRYERASPRRANMTPFMLADGAIIWIQVEV